MAAPHVAGVAALIMGMAPNLPDFLVKWLILKSVDPVPDLAGKVKTGGRLNAANALALFPTISAAPSITIANSKPIVLI